MSGVTCTSTDSGSVTCTISTSTPEVDLSEVLTAAQAVNSALTTSSSMILIAYGGAGGKGKDYSGGKGGGGGQGGQARMWTSLDSFRTTFGGTLLYLYFGAQGSTDHWGGKGGSSTVVATENLNTTGATTSNVALCAGGGGGGSAANKSNGFPGGDGGYATSSYGHNSTGGGKGGASDSTPNAGGGAGGANGVGGAGGAANNTKDNIAGKAGGNGMGGVGGSVHLGDGPSSPQYWLNLSSAPSGLNGGAGGEGECREGDSSDLSGPDPNMIAEGGGGGGGYGGGGGGGGGLYEDSDAGSNTSGGGGGGGGSYAAPCTVENLELPYTIDSYSSGNGSVMIIFP